MSNIIKVLSPVWIIVCIFILHIISSTVFINKWMGKHVKTDVGTGVIVECKWNMFTPNTFQVRLKENIIDAQRQFLQSEVDIIDQ